MNAVLPYLIMVLWMIGGQFQKGARRFGVPGISLVVSLYSQWKKDKKNWRVLVFLLLIPVLCTGYGVSSVLMRIFKKDWTVRLMYAIMLSIPYGIYIALTPANTMTQYFIITIALIGAFQVRAGSLGKIGKYDILIEDIVRSLTVGYALQWVLA